MGHRKARGPASVAACALIASLTLSGGAALADGNGAGDSAQSGATTEAASTDEVTAQVVPVASDTAESTTDTTTPVSSDAASGLSALSSATSSAADTPDPDDGTELIEYFTFFVFPVSGPFNDDVQVSQNWGTVIFDSNDAWSRGENPLVITVSAAPGYRLQPDQKTVWEFWDEPEVTTIPSFTLPAEVSESDARDWTPDVPEGVEVTADSGWKDDATRTITVAPKDGYAFTDGQQTEFTITVTRPDSEEEWQYSNRDPLCAADAPDGVAGWYIYTNKYRFDYEWNTEAQAWVKSLVGTLIESRLIFSGELTGEELARCSDVDDETTLIPLFTFPETHIDRDAGDSIFGDLPVGVLVASDTGFLADNTRTVTFAAAEGYKFSEGQQGTWVFTTDPLSATVPTFTLPSEIPEADAPTWAPSVPEGVTIASDSGWNSDGTRVITVSPKDGYTFTDGQQSQFTITVKKTVPLPVDPDNPTQPTTPDNSGGDTDQQSGAPTPSSTPTSSSSTEAAKVSVTTTDGDTLAKTGADSTTLAAAAGLLLALGAGLATIRRMRKA